MAQIQLNIKQSAFNDVYLSHLLDYTKRYEIYYGGAGSGKSVFVAQKLLIKALKNKRKVLVIRKVGTTLKDSVFQLITDMLKNWQVYNYCKVNLTTYTITLPNDSVFLFKGMDDSEKIVKEVNVQVNDIINLKKYGGNNIKILEITDENVKISRDAIRYEIISQTSLYSGEVKEYVETVVETIDYDNLITINIDSRHPFGPAYAQPRYHYNIKFIK
jgi:phage terminase large subunit